MEEASGKLRETMAMFQARDGESLPWDREEQVGKSSRCKRHKNGLSSKYGNRGRG